MISTWKLKHTVASTTRQRQLKWRYWIKQLEVGDKVFVQVKSGDTLKRSMHRVSKVQLASRIEESRVWINGAAYGLEHFERRASDWTPRTIWTAWSYIGVGTVKQKARNDFRSLLMQFCQLNTSDENIIKIASLIKEMSKRDMRAKCDKIMDTLRLSTDHPVGEAFESVSLDPASAVETATGLEDVGAKWDRLKRDSRIGSGLCSVYESALRSTVDDQE